MDLKLSDSSHHLEKRAGSRGASKSQELPNKYQHLVDLNPDDLDINHPDSTVLGVSNSTSGIVHTATHRPSGCILAIKKYNLEAKPVIPDEDGTDAFDFQAFASSIMNEVSTMKHFRHPNLLPCLVSFVFGPEVFLVTPFYKYRSAKDLLDFSFPEGLPVLPIVSILRDILSALKHLHCQAIVHRSVRASHILVDVNGRACLSGFRYSCSLMEVGQGAQDRYDFPISVAKTNLNWLSPEILAQNLLGYNEKSDIYSLGVTTCELANGIVPFSDMPGTLMLLEKLRGVRPKILDCTTFTPGNHPGDSGVGASVGSSSNLQAAVEPHHTTDACKRRDTEYSERRYNTTVHQFVADCTALEANIRPSASQLLHHSIFKLLKKAGPNWFMISELCEAAKSTQLVSEPEKVSDRALCWKFEDQVKLEAFQGEDHLEWDLDSDFQVT